MKLFALSTFAILAASAPARAETFHCVFTEPFVDFTFDTATQILAKNDTSNQKKSRLTNVTFLVKGPAEFVLRHGGKDIATLKLDNQGSDGMSDNVFPYSVESSVVSGANSGVGGCSSKLLPMKVVKGDGDEAEK